MALLPAPPGQGRRFITLPFAPAPVIARLAGLLPTPPLTGDQIALLRRDNIVDGEAFPSMFGTPASLEDMLPTLASPGPASRLQRQLDARRTHYLNRR